MEFFVETSLLFAAGLIGGVMNALAGGGSGVTFAALIITGMPPIIANATNTFAATLGYITGAIGYRKHVYDVRGPLVWQLPLVFVGGLIGGWMLLQTDAQIFEAAVPWLFLFATVLFMLGGRLQVLATRLGSRHVTILGAIAIFLTCIYGGYFNGGFGILTLAALSLAGYTAVRAMNGIKLIFATVSSLGALVLFIHADAIDYTGGLAVMTGIGIGSYGAARLTDYVSDDNVKRASLIVCLIVTTYAFWRYYGPYLV
jgi:uncharacterized membrane protein YfcA